MRLNRPTTMAVCAAVVLSVLPSTAALAAERSPTTVVADQPVEPTPITGDPTRLVESSLSAEEALAAVAAAFRPTNVRPRGTAGSSERSGRDLTMAMTLLARQLDELSPADRQLAEGYLARPTDGASDPEDSGYDPDAPKRSTCGTHVCVTWVTRTGDAPPAADGDGDGTPDQVERTRSVMNTVWKRIITDGGYRAPLPDRGFLPRRGIDEGPDSRFDVYLADLGNFGYYGYCAPDAWSTRNGRDARGYCVLEDDYRRGQFGTNTPLENLQVTAAHEFFHAVQFSYDFLEDWWFMEGTAAWIEDELYDGVNDNLQYLGQSQLRRPDVPLDYVSGSWLPYGSWIFWRFLTERFPAENGTGLPTIMRRVWERADDADPARPGTYSLKALTRELAARGTSFTRVYAEFAEANRHPRSRSHHHYEEGRSYPKAPLLKRYTVSRSKPRIGWQSVAMRQLSSRTVAFQPGKGLRGNRWRLRVHVDAPLRSRGSSAELTVYRKGGSIASRAVPLNADGVGRKVFRFSTPEVVRVELTMVNASTRYNCDRGTNASCGGVPKDSGRWTKFRVRAFR